MSDPVISKPPRTVIPNEKQREILRLKAEGKNRTEIATEIGMSLPLMDRELYAACCILGVKNGTAAVAVGISEGWLTLGNGEAL